MTTRRVRFRFPVAAIAFMALAFTGAIMAISMASRAAQGLTRSTPFANSYAGYPWFLLGPFVIMFAITLVIAVAIWGSMYAQRRAGVHRLEHAETWKKS